jgi:hypothetical protein
MSLNKTWAVVLVFILHLSLPGVLQATAVPLDVDVAIQVNAMKAGWTTAEFQQVVSTVQRSLVEYLRTTYRYWNFQVKTGQAPVGLSFQVVETIPNQISLRLELLLGGVKSGDVPDKVWLRPTDVLNRGFPASRAAADIFAAFKTVLLDPSALQIDTWLKKEVPIASGGQWLKADTETESEPSEPRIVLPLSWDKFQLFSLSVFRLGCLSPQQTEAELVSVGQGTSAEYPGQPPYQALVVVPVSLIQGNAEMRVQDKRDEVLALKPVVVFLKEERRSSTSLFIPR